MASIVTSRHRAFMLSSLMSGGEYYVVEFGRAAFTGVSVELDLFYMQEVLHAEFKIVKPATGWKYEESVLESDKILTAEAITVDRPSASMGDVEFDFYVIGIPK